MIPGSMPPSTNDVTGWLVAWRDGDQTALAASCGLDVNALKAAVHRSKRRFRQLVKAEVAGTLNDPGLVEGEMRALFAALGC